MRENWSVVKKRGDLMAECFHYDIVREGEENILRVDCESCTFLPSLEDSPMTMSKTIDILTEITSISRLVFVKKETTNTIITKHK